MLKAFTYMFEDSKFYKKAAFLLLFEVLYVYSSLFGFSTGKGDNIELSFIPALVVTGAVFLFNVIINGYQVANMRALRDNAAVLPYMNLKNNFKLGFKLAIAYMLIAIPVLLIIGIEALLIAISAAFSSKLLGLFVLSLIAIIVIFIILVALLLPAFTLLFAKEDSWINFYKFKECFSIIKTYPKSYFLVCILNILINAVVVLKFSVYFIPVNALFQVIFMVILHALYNTYALFVISYLIAKKIEV